MNKFFYAIAAGLVFSLVAISSSHTKRSSIPDPYRVANMSCSQSTFFSYARDTSDQVYFPVLKSMIHHTYN